MNFAIQHHPWNLRSRLSALCCLIKTKVFSLSVLLSDDHTHSYEYFFTLFLPTERQADTEEQHVKDEVSRKKKKTMFKCQSKAGIISTCVIFCVRKVMNQHSLQFYKELKVVFIRSRTKGDVVRTQYSCERRSTIRLYDTSVREVLQTLLDGLNHIFRCLFFRLFSHKYWNSHLR